MSRSVLLQLARDSIEEVLEARRKIKKQELLENYPLLAQEIATELKIYKENSLRGSFKTAEGGKSLLEDIIYNAKKAAFEDPNFSPLSTSEYLECEIELTLDAPEGKIAHRDPSLLSTTQFKIEDLLEE